MDHATLAAHAARLMGRTLTSLFAEDAGRAQRLTVSAAGLTLDISKQRLDAPALDALKAFAAAQGFDDHRAALFAGAPVNFTEGRAALHMALRGPAGGPAIAAEVAAARERAKDFVAAFEKDRSLGSGKPITGILHLGTGGSDLGPRLILEALAPLQKPDLHVAFAANIDGADIADALAGLDPAATLVVVVSKTFTTLETMANADVAAAWLRAALGSDAANRRLAAVSAAPDKAVAWGVPAAQVFPFWDWVGGRYSVWSNVGLSVELAVGSAAFDAFLGGAAAMDAHFAAAPLLENLPALGALVAHWNREALGHASTVTAPYAHRLRRLPDWLAQLEMESNGKRVTRNGAVLDRPAAGVTWGAAGAVAQHSFFQMLHQGLQETPVDFLLVEGPMEGPEGHRASLLANALAQAQALMIGRSQEETLAMLRARGEPEDRAAALAPHMTFPGDRASSILGLQALDPAVLGALLAFYEHRTVAQAWLAGVNPFDQWGVELGKAMAGSLTPLLRGTPAPEGLDGSTRQWIERLR